MVMVMMAFVRLAVGIRTNLLICMLGEGIFGFGSGGGVNNGCCGLSLAQHQHQHQDHHLHQHLHHTSYI